MAAPKGEMSVSRWCFQYPSSVQATRPRRDPEQYNTPMFLIATCQLTPDCRDQIATAMEVADNAARQEAQLGSLEGVGGALTSEVCHSKADTSVITGTQLFFENLSRPFFKKFYVVKCITFSTSLALLATSWRKHGQVTCPTFSYILPNNANLVARSCLEGRALSDR